MIIDDRTSKEAELEAIRKQFEQMQQDSRSQDSRKRWLWKQKTDILSNPEIESLTLARLEVAKQKWEELQFVLITTQTGLHGMASRIKTNDNMLQMCSTVELPQYNTTNVREPNKPTKLLLTNDEIQLILMVIDKQISTMRAVAMTRINWNEQTGNMAYIVKETSPRERISEGGFGGKRKKDRSPTFAVGSRIFNKHFTQPMDMSKDGAQKSFDIAKTLQGYGSIAGMQFYGQSPWKQDKNQKEIKQPVDSLEFLKIYTNLNDAEEEKSELNRARNQIHTPKQHGHLGTRRPKTVTTSPAGQTVAWETKMQADFNRLDKKLQSLNAETHKMIRAAVSVGDLNLEIARSKRQMDKFDRRRPSTRISLSRATEIGQGLGVTNPSIKSRKVKRKARRTQIKGLKVPQFSNASSAHVSVRSLQSSSKLESLPTTASPSKRVTPSAKKFNH